MKQNTAVRHSPWWLKTLFIIGLLSSVTVLFGWSPGAFGPLAQRVVVGTVVTTLLLWVVLFWWWVLYRFSTLERGPIVGWVTLFTFHTVLLMALWYALWYFALLAWWTVALAVLLVLTIFFTVRLLRS